ncbi:hypothetical protein P0092_02005 [Ruminiclostridium papyrosolvens DSM 2782]|uniref:hypothetical protein n=1 Tax=Ruminiclostridium papyrosolvens TaxID=29362 RepID=UPI000592E3CC|nr:hypothetical protein [Ruminiclostridium papyrosolvens]WES34777.1 hypothetical protein P0092_02005 [Ruminiclostridium papyrosolvens DSM 2782]
MEAWLRIFAVVYRRTRIFYRKTFTMNVSDGKISYEEPLETLANILEAIIDTILYGSTGVK